MKTASRAKAVMPVRAAAKPGGRDGKPRQETRPKSMSGPSYMAKSVKGR